MFSKNSVIIIVVVFLITVNIIALTLANDPYPSTWPGKILISVVAPFQEITNNTVRFVEGVWRHYFSLVSVSRENERLKRALTIVLEKNKDKMEIELSNTRLRSLLNFQKAMKMEAMACEVIAKDPSSLIRTVIINKGEVDGLKQGMPVVVPEGIVGRIIELSGHYAKVLLAIDINSGVDALIQKTRARGIVKGAITGNCRLDYVIWREEVMKEDVVISSGLDGVYPKGYRLGKVTEIMKNNSGLFQEITVEPFVDFEKLEEVLVLVSPLPYQFATEQ